MVTMTVYIDPPRWPAHGTVFSHLVSDESLDEHFAGMSGKVINGQFTLDGIDFTCLDGGPLFTFNESISFIVSCADQAEIDDVRGFLGEHVG